MDLKLASEATAKLDFGEGTKIRVGNSTITLKGTFYREDACYIRHLKAHEDANNAAHAALNGRSGEKYPYDAGKPLPERIGNLQDRCDFNLKEKNKLLDMVAVRDTTNRELKAALKQFADKMVIEAKDNFFRAITVISETYRG